MDEIRPLGDAMGPALSLEELDARLEAVVPVALDAVVKEPCVWACECFGSH